MQIIKELALQELLINILNNVSTYFDGQSPMSKQKAIATIHTLFSKISKEFPFVYPIINISKRLVRDIQERVLERTPGTIQRRKTTGLREFMQNIPTQKSQLQRNNSEQAQQSFQSWLKKMVVQSVQYLRQDIQLGQQQVAIQIQKKLRKHSLIQKTNILFFDSFLTNQKCLSGLKNCNIKKIVLDQAKQNQILIENSGKQLRKAKILILSSDAILSDGAILVKSGGSILASVAKQLGVIVLAISRSYCISDSLIQNQEPLALMQNGRNYFPNQKFNDMRVIIGKKYDYVPRNLIDSLVGQDEGWQNSSVSQIYHRYYN